MKKVVSLLLAAVLLLGDVVPVTAAAEEAPAERTESTESQVSELTAGMRTSDEGVRILKEEEGFCKYPIWDYTQWTVGYGSRCPDDMLDTYNKEGITEAAAETLLRNFLIAIEQDIKTRIVDAYGLELTQNQFDALVLFSYNCGTGWTYETNGTLHNAIKNQVTGNELIRAFALWCNAGGQVKDFLLRRRLSEANMYLNGIYDRQPPKNYTYVMYDENGGRVSPHSQGYDSNLTAEPYPVAKYDGYIFQGWFTERKGGTKVNTLDASTSKTTLYAQWLDAEGNPPEQKPFNPVTITVTGIEVNLRKGPGTNYQRVGSAHKGDRLTITELGNGSGYVWGKSSKGWIALEYTNYDTVSKEPQKPDENIVPPETTVPETTAPETTPPEETKPQQPVGQTGVVYNCRELRIRTGPSTSYAVAGYLPVGTKVTITEKRQTGAMVWGKIDRGWISLDYVKLDENTEPSETTWGTVKVGDYLRVRSGPSTSYSIVGYLKNGDRVEVSERRTTGSMTWGKISNGWISLDYVVFDSESKPSDPSESKTVTGDVLNVRSNAGTSNAVVGYLVQGNRVEILEKKTIGGREWGRISSGWICLDYAK